MIIERPQGGTIEIDEDGNVSINDIGTIKRIDLKNLNEVKTHRILRDNEGAIHEIDFYNGGHARLSYTFAGKLREFTANNVSYTLTTENVVILGPNLRSSEVD